MQNLQWMNRLLQAGLDQRLANNPTFVNAKSRLQEDVRLGKVTALSAAQQLLDLL